MVRGVRGATTTETNEEKEILDATKEVIAQMITENDISPEQVAQVIITVTPDLNATFPAKVLRSFDGWTYVPVMCATEIDVPHALKQCIRIMMTINTDKQQTEIKHIYLKNAKQLRPDITR